MKLEKSSRICFGFVTAVLLFSMISTIPHFASGATSADLATRLGGTATGIYYPLYSLSELPQVLAAKKAFPNVPFMVNINPASGPGTSPSIQWTNAITQLKNAGAVVTGYVPTAYGTGRSIANVEGMISSYQQFYPNLLDGIMFDEVSGSCSEFTFYKTISDYAHSLGYSYLRANPGGSICQTDVPLFNHIAIFESSGYPSESKLASRTYYPQYSKDVVGFGTTIHTTSTYDPTWLHMATKYVKWVYITDQTEPNPYAVFPSYFNQYLTDLSSLAGTTQLGNPSTSGGSITVDKPVYTISVGGTTVQISGTVIASSSGGKVTLSLVTPDNTTNTLTALVTSSGSFSEPFLLDKNSALGTYTITGSYNGATLDTTSFSVVSPSSAAPNPTIISQPPTGLTATTFSSSQINLSWTAPSNNGGSAITGYKIERSTDSGTTWSTVVSNTGSTSTTSSDTGLSPSTAYTYRISAINSVGTSSPSTPSSATTSSATTTPQAPTGLTTSTGVMVPLYSYPGNYWTQTIQAKNAHPSVPMVAIINPNNGPNSSIDSNYVNGIKQLQAAGITVLGYVYTHYGARSTSSIEADINTYNNWYHVSGIFFDEMANTAGHETYYSNLSSYVKSLGMTMTVGNPGTDTAPSYIGTVDILDIYENPGMPALSNLAGWHTSYPKSNFGLIGFGVSSLPAQTTITADSAYVSYMYITDDTLPNPYDTVPSYLSNNVAMLDTGISTTTASGSPTGLTATAASSSQIDLSWTAPSNNGGSTITGYEIERSTDSGTTWSTLVANTGSTSTTSSDTGLNPSTAYTYRISAINSVGTGSTSTTSSATTDNPTTAPQPPTGLTATTTLSSQINLSWTAPSNNGGSTITGYEIERSTNSGITWSTLVANTDSTSTTYSNAGLAPSTAYTYRVSAINSVGTSSPSNTASIIIPQPPTGLTAAAASSSQIDLSWTAPSNNGGSTITGYEIERSTDRGTTWSTVASNTGSTSTTSSDTGLNPSTAYTYRILAINSVGTSSPSNTASVTTASVTTSSTITQPPTGLTATAASSSQIDLSWTAPSNNGGSTITGYEIERSTDSGTTWSTLVANTGSTSTTSSDTGLAPSTDTYRVSAINAIGTSSPSNTASATINSAITQVTVTVNSVDMSGTPFTGMWTTLISSTTTKNTGYTPMTYTVDSASQYTVTAANYQNYVFSHWSDGSTNPSITVTPTQNITLVAYYNTGTGNTAPQPSITVNSVDLSGNPITGLWTVLRDTSGTTLAQGFTPTTFTVTSGNTYVVHAGNYQNYVFDHWSNGDKTSYYTITPTQSATLTAYYSTG